MFSDKSYTKLADVLKKNCKKIKLNFLDGSLTPGINSVHYKDSF